MKISTVNVWTRDQDEALAWYTEKLGFELRVDVTVAELGDFRWVEVGPAGQPDVSFALMTIPGAPVFDAQTEEQVRALTASGHIGALFLSTEDCVADHAALVERGVEFTEPPSPRPYGTQAICVDPSGNQIMLVQPPAAPLG